MKKVRIVIPLLSKKKELKDEVMIGISNKYLDLAEVIVDFNQNGVNILQNFVITEKPKGIDLKNYYTEPGTLMFGEVDYE